MKSRGRRNRRKAGLDGKKILLVVTGGISVYKSAFLVRLFKRAGAGVRVVMTGAAARFVTPLTFEVLSENPVPLDMFERRDEPSVGHIELAGWPDAIVVAPATADFLGRVAAGLAGDLPAAVLCASKAPVWFAPAMNDGMWANPAVRRSIEILKADGKHFIDPGSGELACGTEGPGRMAEPAEIFAAVERSFLPGPLDGVRFLVTAGRTEEEIDPVRYISNRSSGRMGFAIAERAKELGAEVTLIHGPVAIDLPRVDSAIPVRSAAQMKTAVAKAFPRCDVLVMTAAVADFAPSRRSPVKMKKGETDAVIKLKRTPDILASLRKAKKPGQIVVGFALESEKGEENAVRKITEKGCDYLVLNMVGEKTGFEAGTNSVTLFKGVKKLAATSVITKKEAAAAVIEMLLGDRRLKRA